MPTNNAGRLDGHDEEIEALKDGLTKQAQDFGEKFNMMTKMTQAQEEQMKFQEEVRSSMQKLNSDLQAVSEALPRSKENGNDLVRGGSSSVDRPPPNQGGDDRPSSNRGRFFLDGGGFEMPRGSGFNATFGELRNGGGSSDTSNWRYRRLEFPVFSGENPDGWIMRVERYFAFYHLSEEEKIEASVVGLDGDALLWFQWENNRRPITRWSELKSLVLHHPFTAQSVAAIFVKNVVKLHGFPTSIVSDRDKVFMSVFWRELFRLQGTTLLRSTSYHPQTDGQSEIVNQALETYLRCFVNGQPRQWSQWLHWAEYCYNTSPHTSTKMTPFLALYGRPPPPLIRVGHGNTQVDSLEQRLQERDAMVDDLVAHLIHAQQLMKKNADKNRRDVQFQQGDKVYLKLQPYRQRSLATRKCEKLAPRFYGPYNILEKIGNTWEHSMNIPRQLTTDLELQVTPEEVLGVRQRAEGQDMLTEVLMKWKELPESEATWENYLTMHTQFPWLHLEDKVNLVAAGNVIERVQLPIKHTYKRRYHTKE